MQPSAVLPCTAPPPTCFAVIVGARLEKYKGPMGLGLTCQEECVKYVHSVTQMHAESTQSQQGLQMDGQGG